MASRDDDDIVVDTILLEGVLPVAWSRVEDGILMTKFDRAAVAGLVSPPEATLTVAGELADGTEFTGRDTIRVR